MLPLIAWLVLSIGTAPGAHADPRFGRNDETAMRCELARSVEGLQATLVFGRDF